MGAFIERGFMTGASNDQSPTIETRLGLLIYNTRLGQLDRVNTMSLVIRLTIETKSKGNERTIPNCSKQFFIIYGYDYQIRRKCFCHMQLFQMLIPTIDECVSTYQSMKI